MKNVYRNKFSRYGMYTNIEKVLSRIKLKTGDCLVIGDTLKGKGANSTLVDMLPRGLKVTAPDFPEVDMQDIPYRDNSYDYVVSDQVLEHVRKPWIGVSEIYRVLRPGGIAIVTSALMFPQHGVPYDYFRFTPAGLKVLFEDFSTIHSCTGNGNKKFIGDLFVRGITGQVSPSTPKAKQAMICDDKYLVSVWIIAEK